MMKPTTMNSTILCNDLTSHDARSRFTLNQFDSICLGIRDGFTVKKICLYILNSFSGLAKDISHFLLLQITITYATKIIKHICAMFMLYVQPRAEQRASMGC